MTELCGVILLLKIFLNSVVENIFKLTIAAFCDLEINFRSIASFNYIGSINIFMSLYSVLSSTY